MALTDQVTIRTLTTSMLMSILYADLLVYLNICVKAGGVFLSVIADQKIGKSAAPSRAGGEGPH